MIWNNRIITFADEKKETSQERTASVSQRKNIQITKSNKRKGRIGLISE